MYTFPAQHARLAHKFTSKERAAESRMKMGAGVTYAYDGDGKRVSKSTGKLYWYTSAPLSAGGMGSDPLIETDAAGNNPVEYVFFGGKRIARRKATGEVNYYFADHLGSSRAVTNASGTILDDSDFYPFGGEHPVLSPSSGNAYKFTGKERDSESGNHHAMFRDHVNRLRRFSSTDPLLKTLLESDTEDEDRALF